ncbi:hypothetical protein HPB47_021747, partial [Ixodes persulcatus]
MDVADSWPVDKKPIPGDGDAALFVTALPSRVFFSSTLVSFTFGNSRSQTARNTLCSPENVITKLSAVTPETGYIQTATQGLLTIEPVRGEDGVRDKDDSRSPHLLTLHQVGPDVDAAPSFPASSSSRNATTRATWRGAIESNEVPWLGLRRPPRSRHRRKRSYSLEQHVEVLVAADSKMARYHGKNLKHYILTLMAA